MIRQFLICSGVLWLSMSLAQAALMIKDADGALSGHTSSAYSAAKSSIDIQCDNMAQNPDLQQFCHKYAISVQRRVKNIAHLVYTVSGKTVSYEGYFRFFTLSENAPFLGNAANDYISPDQLDGVKQQLLGLFDALQHGNMNYAAWLTSKLGQHAEWPQVPTYAPYATPQTPQNFAEGYYVSMHNTYLNNPSFLNSNRGDYLALNHQFGNGGGFGCTFGPVVLNDEGDAVLGEPVLEFGAGLGQGISENNGIDFGYGGGSALCTPGSLNCAQSTTNYIGGGAGKNDPLLVNIPITHNTDSEGLPASTTLTGNFKQALDQATGHHQTFYLSCGSGGGGGFQTLPTGRSTGVFKQTFGFGGGGYSLAIFNVVPQSGLMADSFMAMPNKQASKAELTPKFANLYQQWSSGALAERSVKAVKTNLQQHSLKALSFMALNTAAPVANANAYRGMFTADNVARIDLSSLPSKVGFVYQPYHFPLPENSEKYNTKYVYMPHSDSAADLFFSLNGNIRHYQPNPFCSKAAMTFNSAPVSSILTRDISTIRSIRPLAGPNEAFPMVLFGLNPNPQGCVYSQDNMARNASNFPSGGNINTLVLNKLTQKNIPIALGLPFSYLPGDGTSAGIPPIVNANQALIDTAVNYLKTYSNINTLVILSGDRDIVQSYPAGCSVYNYNSIGLRSSCAGYPNDPTFKDYKQLISAIIHKIQQSGKIKRPITLLVEQSADAWLSEPRIVSAQAPYTIFANFFNAKIKPLSTAQIAVEPLINVSASEGEDLNLAIQSLTTLPMRIQKMGLMGSNGQVALIVGWGGQSNTKIQQYMKQVFSVATHDLGIKVNHIFVDQLFNQPWKGLSFETPGTPAAICGHVYPVAHLGKIDPMGPPLTQQIPIVCSPDFTQVTPGAQPAPICMCLTNSTNYYATFYNFVSNSALPPNNNNTDMGHRDFIQVPPNTVMTFAREGDSFYDRYIQGKDGSFSLATIFTHYPYSQSAVCQSTPGAANCPPLGGKVPLPIGFNPHQQIPSLKCVGVSDAQFGAANANTGFACDQVFFLQSKQQTYMRCGGQPCILNPETGMYESPSNNITLHWTTQGTGFQDVTGWQVKTLQAPPPTPGQVVPLYAQAPLIIVPQQDNVINPSAVNTPENPGGTVASSYTYTNLSPGIYWFRVQPVSGIPSVDGIDTEYLPVKVTDISGKTDWSKTGKFTVDFPMVQIHAGNQRKIVKAMIFDYKQNGVTKSFTLYPPIDNGISDISLPGNMNATQTGVTFPVTLTVKFKQGPDCVAHLQITPGSDQGGKISPDGQAKILYPGAYTPEKVCYLEMEGDRKFVNGHDFQFTTIRPKKPH